MFQKVKEELMKRGVPEKMAGYLVQSVIDIGIHEPKVYLFLGESLVEAFKTVKP